MEVGLEKYFLRIGIPGKLIQRYKQGFSEYAVSRAEALRQLTDDYSIFYLAGHNHVDKEAALFLLFKDYAYNKKSIQYGVASALVSKDTGPVLNASVYGLIGVDMVSPYNLPKLRELLLMEVARGKKFYLFCQDLACIRQLYGEIFVESLADQSVEVVFDGSNSKIKMI